MKFVDCFDFVKIGAVGKHAAVVAVVVVVECTEHTGWGLHKPTALGSKSIHLGKSHHLSACTAAVAVVVVGCKYCSADSTDPDIGSVAVGAEFAGCKHWQSPCSIAAAAAVVVTDCCTVGKLGLDRPFDIVTNC